MYNPGRLIPARAGKTRQCQWSFPARTAHPRAGGENDQGAPDHGWPVGSSPRGRGKLVRAGQPQGRERLIPARAGKTVSAVFDLSVQAAHPRAGGENTTNQTRRRRLCGSSPRGRGKLLPCRCYYARLRLIPARAGKTHPRTHTRV